MDIVQCSKWGGEISVIIFIVGRRFIVKGGAIDNSENKYYGALWVWIPA